MKKATASTLTLIMLNIAATGSLNNLPSLATVGLTSITYYVIAMALFFIPYALIVAELASGYTEENGIYIWVKDAFGPRWGFTAAWLQWIENLFWYPTILSFIASAFGQLIHPELATNKIYNVTATLSIYWILTVANLNGIRASAIISLIGSSLGILLPGILLIVFGLFWYFTQHPLSLTFSWHALNPDFHHTQNLAFIVGIALTLAGLEISAVHAPHVRNPQKAYPVSILSSTVLVIASSILGSLAIAAIVPAHAIDLNNGVAQAFGRFLGHFNIPYLGTIIMVLMAIGGMTAASTWISGPSSSLAQAAKDKCIPSYFYKLNSAGISLPILAIQGLLVSLFCGAFIIMPTVSSAYWLLTVLGGQLYLIMYIIMFAAAIKLRVKNSRNYAYKIKGVKTTWLVSGVGSISCFVFVIIGFLPPHSLRLANYGHYYFIQTTALAISLILPPIIYYLSQLEPVGNLSLESDTPLPATE
jgi:glutamate:GABA antiporter